MISLFYGDNKSYLETVMKAPETVRLMKVVKAKDRRER